MKLRKGFTLIELLVVIAIIGILATIVTLQVGGAQVRARNSRAQSDISQGGKAIETWFTNTGSSTYSNSVVVANTHVNQTSRLGATAVGSWATLFSSTGTYSVALTTSASSAHTYAYVTNLAANSTIYCLSTNTTGSGNVGFAVINGNTRSLAAADPTYTATTPTAANICL